MLPPHQDPHKLLTIEPHEPDSSTPKASFSLSNIPTKHHTPLLILGILAVFLVGSVLAFYLFSKSQSNDAQTSTVSTDPILTPAETSQQEILDSSIASWPTFTAENDQLSFKYPKLWQVQSTRVFGSRSVTEFAYQNDIPLSVSIVGNHNQETGQPYQNLDEYLGATSQKATSIQIAGNTGKLVDDPGGAYVITFHRAVVFTPDNKSLIEFDYKPDNFEGSENTLTQILSTFSFNSLPSSTPLPFPTLPQFNEKFPNLKFNNSDKWDAVVSTTGIEHSIIFSKDSYTLKVSQAAWSPTTCLFEDSQETEGSSRDLTDYSYDQMNTTLGSFRYLEITPKEITFCHQTTQNYYQTPTIFGRIILTYSEDPNELLVNEALKIIKSMQKDN